MSRIRRRVMSSCKRKRSQLSSESESDDNGDGLYNVEEIVCKKIKNDQSFYFVKWEGFSHVSNTWEPEKGFKYCPHVLKEFEDKQLTIEMGQF